MGEGGVALKHHYGRIIISSMKKVLSSCVALLFALPILSCGTTQNDGTGKTFEERIAKFIPAGFSIAEKRNMVGDNLFVLAKSPESGIAQYMAIIADDSGGDLKIVKQAKPFRAENVQLAPERQWGAKLSDNEKGYAIMIKFGGDRLEDTFVKVLDSSFNEIPNELGPGYATRDFEDVDFDGNFDIIALDTRWSRLAKTLGSQPYTQRVCTYNNGKFVFDNPRFKDRYDAGIKAFTAKLDGEVQYENEAFYYSLNLLLVQEVLGQAKDGLSKFQSFIGTLKDEKLIGLGKELLGAFTSQVLKGKELSDPLWKPYRAQAWEPLFWKD